MSDVSIPADHLACLRRYPDHPDARDYVHRLKDKLIVRYGRHGASNFQLGEAYPFTYRLDAQPLSLLRAGKAALVPDDLPAPGAVGL